MQSDLDRVASDEWVRHFNDRYYEGEWSGVALRAVGGASAQIYTDPTRNEPLTDTPVLARSPSLQRALATIECPVKSARLLKLGPAARIIEHRDYNLSLEDGEVRLHVPITTSPLVEFYINGERIDMLAGECWYINANLPHKAENRSSTDRVHLVIDCVVDDWLRSLVASARPDSEASNAAISVADRPSSPEALERFRSLVFDDVDLQERLRQVADRGLFIDLAVRLGEERGCSFNAEDVREALRANRREWIERWV
ncbi:MAG TPA: aspartyl/asparaginyl beta-hydroxylase domain-containing protein [Blastocatellia bacterium]|nr:aspartyl/asparaginyl beta-hydroxylase domain-containing protein [Blastocatellia bacterium]